MDVNVYLEGAKRAYEKLQAEREKIERNKVRATRAGANAVKKVMRAEAPVSRGRKAGRRHLRQTIGVHEVAGGAFSVKPHSHVTHLVVQGAARGQVEHTANAKTLHWSQSGSDRFAATVHVGPMPANNFIARTREIVHPEIKPIVGEVLFHGAPDPNEGA